MTKRKKSVLECSRISRRRLLWYGLAGIVSVAGGLLPTLVFEDANLPAGPKIEGGPLSVRQFQLELQRLKDLKKSLLGVEWGKPLTSTYLPFHRGASDSDFGKKGIEKESTATSRILFSSLHLC